MNYKDISAMVIDETNALIYISDPETYELLYLNQATLRVLGNPAREQWFGQPCYKVLQGKEQPCDFCTNSRLNKDSFYIWEHYNEMVGRYFTLKDKFVEMDGRLVRLEIADDVTLMELEHQKLQENLDAEKVVLSCLQALSQSVDIDQAIQELLAILGGYYRAERAYIFEIYQDQSMLANTYEWCRSGIGTQKENLQNIPLHAISRWMEKFRQSGYFYISSLGDSVDKNSLEYQILEPQGVESLMAAPLCINDQIVGFLGVDNPAADVRSLTPLRSVAAFIGSDVSRRRLMERLTVLSYTDALTGLGNRHKYMEALEALERRGGGPLGIVYADINGLKKANDTYGHQYGDYLIQHAAKLLELVFKQQIFRVGGDEYVVLCTDMSRSDFEDKVRQLRRLADNDETLHMAIGVTWNESGEGLSQQVAHTDELLYIDKQTYFGAADFGISGYRHNRMDKLLRELREGRFLVYLQPKIWLRTGALGGAEALVRRFGDNGELVSPGQFVAQYEAEGMIRYVDFFVLETVCRTLRFWREQGLSSPQVAVNFSRVSMMEYNITDEMQTICVRYGVHPRQIIIEVTEGIGSMAQSELMSLMSSLKRAGFSVALDDFGSKYSNLSLLTDVAFDEVKLDRSLVRDIEANPKARIILSHAVGICRDMEAVHSTAEGIETRNQRDLLDAYGCDIGQGFWFDRPMPIETFAEKYLRAPVAQTLPSAPPC